MLYLFVASKKGMLVRIRFIYTLYRPNKGRNGEVDLMNNISISNGRKTERREHCNTVSLNI